MPQGKTEAFRSRLGNWIMDSSCDNRRPVGRLEADTKWWETQFLRYSSVTRRLKRVLFSMLGMRVGMTVWCTLSTDTETDVFVLMLAYSKNLTLKRCYMKKGRGANIICNSTQAMLTTASWGALIGENSITACDNISAFFVKAKWKAVQLLQPMEGRSELWRVSRERVISIQWEL